MVSSISVGFEDAHRNQSSASVSTLTPQRSPCRVQPQHLGLSAGWQWVPPGRSRLVPAVTISVWLENTQCHDYLCTRVGHIQENSCFYTAWLITAPCCFQVCSFAWNNKSSSLLFLAQEQKWAPPGKNVLTASLEIKRRTGKKARRPSSCGVPAVSLRKERNPRRPGTDLGYHND